MVRKTLHEHAAALPAAGHANRSRRLIKCAKDSGHYQPILGERDPLLKDGGERHLFEQILQ
jgi:hypothetical protein